MPIDVLKSDVFSFLERNTQTFDIIFADPPYTLEIESFELMSSLIFENKYLNNDGLLIIEHAKQTDLKDLNHFEELKTYGGNCFSFFR
jgi:16S rRNA G966 N2-methylase RsmD